MDPYTGNKSKILEMDMEFPKHTRVGGGNEEKISPKL
jgi:hypothetical protein